MSKSTKKLERVFEKLMMSKIMFYICLALLLSQIFYLIWIAFNKTCIT
jgi:hypothetical protein